MTIPGALRSLAEEKTEKKTTLEKVHNTALKSEPFILEADLAARSSNQEKSPRQVRERVFGG